MANSKFSALTIFSVENLQCFRKLQLPVRLLCLTRDAAVQRN